MNKLGVAKILVGHGIFWFWNVLFLIVAIALLIPEILVPSIYDAYTGKAPVSVAIYSALCIVFPIVCMLAVLWRFRTDVRGIVRVFCGFEIPLFFILLFRVILLRDMNPGLTHLMVNFILAFCAFFYLIGCPVNHGAHPGLRVGLRFAMASIVLVVGLYLALLLIPLAIPLLVHFIKLLFSWDFWQGASHALFNPLAFLFFCLSLLTCSLFLASPVLMVIFYVTTFIREYRGAAALIPKTTLVSIAAGILAVNLTLFVVLNQQPQPAVFAELETLQAEGKQPGQIADKDAARQGLVNAYLGAWRYVSPDQKSNLVKELFYHAFGSRDGVAATAAQELFNGLAKPFLYQGNGFQQDHQLAADYYAKIFDTPIEKAEKQQLLHAIQATWERESAAAGLINAASKTVLLREQRIDVSVERGIAKVNIMHTLENQTFDQHEITLHFSLPRDAVLSGLWLSDDATQLQKFPYVLATRGAAQQVYNNEVSRRVDPSLLEQVGPRQFRLRAFPVPAKTYRDVARSNYFLKRLRSWDVEPLYLSFEYHTLPNRAGEWPAPVLLEKRNLYWDGSTTRYLNGKLISESAWLPSHFGHGQVLTEDLVANLGDFSVVARPRVANETLDISTLKGKRFAVIIDGSYSMASNSQYVDQALSWIEQQPVSAAVWFCQHACQARSQVPGVAEFWGNAQVLQQLQAWQQVSDATQYDAVLVLTDAGSYELEQEIALDTAIDNLLLVHLNQQLPYAYNDQLLALLRRGGSGIATTVEEAFQYYALQRGLELTRQPLAGLDPLPFQVTDNYIWTALTRSAQTPGNASAALQKIAARHWIDAHASNRQNNTLGDLDKLHKLAVHYRIVTDYSSMIVLVNDRQKEALAEAEKGDDRFEREVEQGVEDVSSPTDMFSVVAVPEPEEWILLAIISILLLVAYRRRRHLELMVKQAHLRG